MHSYKEMLTLKLDINYPGRLFSLFVILWQKPW